MLCPKIEFIFSFDPPKPPLLRGELKGGLKK